jgi:hypothetical protein
VDIGKAQAQIGMKPRDGSWRLSMLNARVATGMGGLLVVNAILLLTQVVSNLPAFLA